ncbi:MAG: N-acetyltransferase [Candidatus Schekmanbacteria bacterium]|nr:N-acetyltransferase [Candidatus Schekmanbacteria bacterium]
MLIRPAQMGDVKKIQHLVNSYAQKGKMLPLSLHDIYEGLREFSVAEKDGEIIATCALHFCWENLGELRSLAVQVEHMNQGIGHQLVEDKIKEAKEYGIKSIFVLTYRGQFFTAVGFVPIDKSQLPHKVWADCVKCVKFPDCDESAFVYKMGED